MTELGAQRPRFQQQQHPLGQIRIAVRIAADLMHELMAERKIAERARSIGLIQSEAVDQRTKIVRQLPVLRGRTTINDDRPVDITPARPLTSAERAENYDTDVRTPEPIPFQRTLDRAPLLV